MRIAAVTLALAMTAGSAFASDLDLRATDLGSGLAYSTGQAQSATLLATSRPVRHRRYRDREWGGYREPEYYATLGAGAFDPANQPGNGLYLNGGLGAVLSDQIDLGVQISWYHRSTGGETFVREVDLPDGTHETQTLETQSIDTDLVPLMGTLRVRIPVSPQVEPYVGGGVGWEWLTIAGTDQDGFDFSNDYDGFGAQLFGGANLNVGRSTGLYGEAVWNSSTPKAEFFDPVIGQTVRAEVDYDGLAFHGGLRFMF